MRVTTTIQNRNFLDNINQLKSRLDKAQTEVSTGKTVNRLSDDPLAASQASRLTAVMGANDQFIAMNDQLRSRLELTDTVVQAFIQSVDAAKVLAAQALSGATTPESRAALATEVEGVWEQILSESNTQFNGTFLFAGTQTTVPPFDDSGGSLVYNGNNEATYQRLDRTVVIQTNVTGQELFLDSPPAFTVLDNLKTAILANDTTAIRAALDDLDVISGRVNTFAARAGNSLQLIDQIQGTLRAHNLALQENISRMTDADLAKSITDLNLTNQALNVSMNAQAQVQQLSLLDFLR
jgi:flagellar hook-associated protein 3 FlgL